ncbi:NAD(P)-dependent oxidoreductase [Actinosynnema sp. NPDC059335]|uniref:NAD(P)-dependent oxidoreductase n=1 Tax=Actinosynnema sp. NPDC059335 TaxID=3346804 RepID=UPI00366B8C85
MRITVLGASGGTGTRVVELAREAGHEVTAIVRAPNGRDTVADVMDPGSLGPHVAGADAVVSAIGPRAVGRPTSVQTDSTRSAIAAMGAHGVRRLVVVSNSGMVTEGDDPVSRYLVKPVLRRVFRHPWGDMARMEDVVRASGLEWTIVRPPRLTDGPRTGAYRTAVGVNVRGGRTVSRADLAALVVRCLADPGTVRQVISIAN